VGIVGSLKFPRGGADSNRIFERPLQPLSRSLLRAAALLSLLLIAVVLNALLHSSEDPLNPIAEAAMQTERAPGARIAMVAVYSSPASTRTVTATGGGAYNAHTGRSRMTLEVPSGLGTERIVAVADQTASYMHSPSIAEGLPPGRRWMEIQPWLGRSSSSVLAGQDTRSSLDMLRAVSEGTESLGSATIRGVATEGYRSSISLPRFAELLRHEGKTEPARIYERMAQVMPAPIPVEVWVDDNGLLRRERTVLEIPGEGHPPVQVEMRIDLYDFGVAPKISLPDAREVFDATPAVKAKLHLPGKIKAPHTHASSRPAGPALSPTEFRSKASTVCRQAKQRIRGSLQASAGAIEAAKQDAAQARANGASAEEALRIYGAAAGRYFDPIIRLGMRAVSELDRLEPPAGEARVYRRFVAATALGIEQVRGMVRALEDGNLALAKRIQNEPNHASHRSDVLASKLGLPACVGDAAAPPSGSSA
jgi:hypothetical protein